MARVGAWREPRPATVVSVRVSPLVFPGLCNCIMYQHSIIEVRTTRLTAPAFNIRRPRPMRVQPAATSNNYPPGTYASPSEHGSHGSYGSGSRGPYGHHDAHEQQRERTCELRRADSLARSLVSSLPNDDSRQRAGAAQRVRSVSRASPLHPCKAPGALGRLLSRRSHF